MSDWVAVKASDLNTTEPARKDHHHAFISPKGLAWLRYCRFCGHVGLKNEISVLVSRIGCHFERDPRYMAWAKGLASR